MESKRLLSDAEGHCRGMVQLQDQSQVLFDTKVEYRADIDWVEDRYKVTVELLDITVYNGDTTENSEWTTPLNRELASWNNNGIPRHSVLFSYLRKEIEEAIIQWCIKNNLTDMVIEGNVKPLVLE